MSDTPFLIFALFIGIDIVLGLTGVVMGARKTNGAPFITILAGILMFILMATTVKVDVGYSDAQPANTTQSGGIETCVVSGSTTTCTPTAITKSFSYKNSTNNLVNNPDPIPESYALNQENIWVYMLILGLIWIMLGVLLQMSKW